MIKFSGKSFQWKPSCSVLTDRKIDMTKVIVHLRNMAKAPKKQKDEQTSCSSTHARVDRLSFHFFSNCDSLTNQAFCSSRIYNCKTYSINSSLYCCVQRYDFRKMTICNQSPQYFQLHLAVPHTYLLNQSIKHSISSASQEIPRISWNQKFITAFTSVHHLYLS